MIVVEAGIWVYPAGMDQLLRAAGCQAGVAELLVLDESYGRLGGSWARAVALSASSSD